MTASRRRSTLAVFALAAASACGSSTSDLKQHDTSTDDALTVCPAGTTVQGVDVSNNNGTVNWASVATTNIKWGYTKATEGLTFQDSTFSANWTGMKAHGILRGAYHFFHPGDDGTQQADYFLAYVGTIGPGDLPPMLDWEVADGVSGATADANATKFINEVKAKTGLTTIIYTSPGLWSGFGTSGFGTSPMWVADYFNCYCNTAGTCPTPPTGWSNWIIWQWSDRGTVSGITGGVDLDEYNGTLAQLQTLAGGANCGGKANGTYCGNDGPQNGDANTLYQCTSNEATVIEPCLGFCAKGTDADFCERPIRPAHGPDVDGDGKADLCGRSATGIECWLSTGSSFSSEFAGPALSDTAGWGTLANYSTIQLVDVNGDGKADVCGRGINGAMCWLGNGSGFPTATNQGPLTDAAGWNMPEYGQTIQWADVNGDGKLDLCGRSATSFSCWLWGGDGFGGAQVNAPDMGDAQGWNLVQYYATIVVADVTGDKKADVCGRGSDGFECWVSNGTAFTAAGGYVDAFSDANGGDQVSVFSTIQLGDIDGDGKLDVCGRTSTGYSCFKGLGNGKFSATAIAGPAFSNANGWNVGERYSTIQLADVNGDGKADVCGRGSAALQCWLSNGTGFPTEVTIAAVADASWSAAVYDSTLTFADVDGDGRADLCGRSAAGWECWLANGTGSGFDATPITTTLLADAQNWDAPQYLTTIQLVGTAFAHAVAGTTTTTTSSSSSGSTGTSATTTTGSSASSATSSSTASSSATSTTGGSTGSETTAGSTSGSTSAGTQASGAAGTSGAASTNATTGAVAAGASGSGGSGAPAAGSTTGGAKSGGCASAPGGSLLALMAVVQLFRRRRAQP